MWLPKLVEGGATVRLSRWNGAAHTRSSEWEVVEPMAVKAAMVDQSGEALVEPRRGRALEATGRGEKLERMELGYRLSPAFAAHRRG